MPILATKLYIPPPLPKVVIRPRLIERLNEGLCQEQGFGQKLTLISAPAGFGKTTLLSEWVAGCERPVAWLSLDEGDKDPARFLAYFIAALQTIKTNIGEEVLGMLQSPQLPPIELILIPLINGIATIPEAFIIVLDDYHVMDADPVDQALTFVLEHLPPLMHLVITTREDPNLPLARLRARGQLTELRAADLRFTPAESADFLNRVMGLNLSDKDIAALDTRTEGWIAGLQLAALSMQGHQDVPGFIQAFAGDHRYIVDYLVEEVLKHQPEPVRSFLLQTAILDRLNGSLCDAVTGQEGSSARLEALQRGNVFVVPLDDKLHWYRYHHLFAEVLSVYLMAEQPDQVPTLHRRASMWYEQNGSPADAIRHALVAKDYERAADLIERVFPEMTRSRQEVTLLGWLKALPEALVRDRPVLCNLFAGALLQTGVMEGVDAWLLVAERWLSLMDAWRERPDAPPPAMIVVNQEEFRRLPGAVAMYRAGQALLHGNVDETILYARRVLDLAPEDDFLRRGGAAALQGLALWTNGDLASGQRLYAEGFTWLKRAGYISDALGCSLALADIILAQGRLHEAMRIYERGLQLAAEHGTPEMRGTADMLVGMSELYREQNDLTTAAQYLQRSQHQGESTGLPQNRYRWRVAMAGIQQAQGDLDSALDLLDEAERLYVGDFSPNVRPVAAMTARVWVAQGRLGEALDWAREQGLSAEDNPTYLREFEHITLARILMAQYQHNRTDSSIHEAMGLLSRLLQAAQAGGRVGSEIEILLLQALAQQMRGDIPAALAPLDRALMLAEPEGYVRMFVGEGQSMAQLLREAATQKAASRQGLPDYVSKLLGAFGAERPADTGPSPLPDRQGQPAHAAQHLIEPAAQLAPKVQPAQDLLIEPLSQRELEILRLFKTELSGPEIAQELMIALSTVRTHTNNIYSKLNVKHRRAAVKQAIELRLI